VRTDPRQGCQDGFHWDDPKLVRIALVRSEVPTPTTRVGCHEEYPRRLPAKKGRDGGRLRRPCISWICISAPHVDTHLGRIKRTQNVGVGFAAPWLAQRFALQLRSTLFGGAATHRPHSSGVLLWSFPLAKLSPLKVSW